MSNSWKTNNNFSRKEHNNRLFIYSRMFIENWRILYHHYYYRKSNNNTCWTLNTTNFGRKMCRSIDAIRSSILIKICHNWNSIFLAISYVPNLMAKRKFALNENSLFPCKVFEPIYKSITFDISVDFLRIFYESTL